MTCTLLLPAFIFFYLFNFLYLEFFLPSRFLPKAVANREKRKNRLKNFKRVLLSITPQIFIFIRQKMNWQIIPPLWWWISFIHRSNMLLCLTKEFHPCVRTWSEQYDLIWNLISLPFDERQKMTIIYCINSHSVLSRKSHSFTETKIKGLIDRLCCILCSIILMSICDFPLKVLTIFRPENEHTKKKRREKWWLILKIL